MGVDWTSLDKSTVLSNETERSQKRNFNFKERKWHSLPTRRMAMMTGTASTGKHIEVFHGRRYKIILARWRIGELEADIWMFLLVSYIVTVNNAVALYLLLYLTSTNRKVFFRHQIDIRRKGRRLPQSFHSFEAIFTPSPTCLSSLRCVGRDPLQQLFKGWIHLCWLQFTLVIHSKSAPQKHSQLQTWSFAGSLNWQKLQYV